MGERRWERRFRIPSSHRTKGIWLFKFSMSRIALCLLFVVLVNTCVSLTHAVLPKADPTSVVQRVFQTLTESDCKAFSSLFSEYGILIPLFGGLNIIGRPAIHDACLKQYSDIAIATANYSSLVVSGTTAVVQWESMAFTKSRTFVVNSGLEYFVVNPKTNLLDLVVNYQDLQQSNSTRMKAIVGQVWQAVGSLQCARFGQFFTRNGTWTDNVSFSFFFTFNTSWCLHMTTLSIQRYHCSRATRN
jgi:hypothetical protein